MKTLFRVAHCLLVLALIALLLCTVYYGFSLLRDEQRQARPLERPETNSVVEQRRASPQEIVSLKNLLHDFNVIGDTNSFTGRINEHILGHVG